MLSENYSFCTENEFSILSKKDSVLQNNPKNQIYWRWYNPYSLLKIRTNLILNLEWTYNYSKNKYLGFGGVIYTNRSASAKDTLWEGISNQALVFYHANRLNTGKRWLVFEFDYGLFAEREITPRNYWTTRVEEKFFGIGPYFCVEMQLLVGNWGSISLKNNAHIAFGYRTEKTFLISDPNGEVIYNSDGFGYNVLYSPFYLGVNFYF